MSKDSQWIAGINAVASAVEHDAGNVREVLVEAGAKNPRLVEIEGNARRMGIDVRKVALVIKGDTAYAPAEIDRALGIAPFAEPVAIAR